jgi:hypothetical protein
VDKYHGIIVTFTSEFVLSSMPIETYDLSKDMDRELLQPLPHMANLMLAYEVSYYLAAFNIFLDKAIATRDISYVVIPTSSA